MSISSQRPSKDTRAILIRQKGRKPQKRFYPKGASLAEIFDSVQDELPEAHKLTVEAITQHEDVSDSRASIWRATS